MRPTRGQVYVLLLVAISASCVLPNTALTKTRSHQATSIADTVRQSAVRVRVVSPDGSSVSGSGFVVDPAGHVVTSAELVAGASRLVVTALADNKRVQRPAQITGVDTRSGIAVLHAPGLTGLTKPTWFGVGDIAAPRDIFCATCRTDVKTVSVGGVVPLSGRGRDNPYETLTPMVPVDGQAVGSALFGMDGAVVGMISAIAAKPDGTLHMLALPARTLERIGKALIAEGKVDRGWLGVNIDNVGEDLAVALDLPEARGALVIGLVPGGPAERSPLRIGDIILGAGPTAITGPTDVVRAVGEAAPGTEVSLNVHRQGATLRVPVKLGALSAAISPAEDAGGTEVAAIGLRLKRLSGSRGVEVLDGHGQVPVGAAIRSIDTRPVTGLGEVNRQIAVALAKGRKKVLFHLRIDASDTFVAVDLRQPVR